MSTRRSFLGYAGTLAAATSLTVHAQAENSDPQAEVSGSHNQLRIRIDELMKFFMASQSISAGQLAVLSDGSMLMNRGYSNSRQCRFQVSARSLFRLASCSKIFACAAIDALAQEDRLDLASPVFPLLGITAPVLSSQTPSPFIDSITVQNLVDHAGGWNDHGRVKAKDGTIIPGTNWDPMFHMRDITAQLSLTGPATKRNIAEYMYGEPLQFEPGTQSYDTTRGASYSNFGYMLLGLVVEEVTGESFIDFVRTKFSEPGRPLDVHLSRTLGGSLHNREVPYDDPGLGLSALEPHADIQTPYSYGGEGWTTECADSNGGLMTTAGALARFISRHAVWGLGGRAVGSARTGSQAGTSSYAASLTNGADCAFIFNTRSFPGGPSSLDTFTQEFYNLVNQI